MSVLKTSPKVSVLIPTYNYAHCLDDAIQSVLSQTFTDFELLVVDNGSVDNTKNVVQKYINDPRFRYYRREENTGITDSWNKCLDYANGEYIKYLCADDKFFPTLLERFVQVMEQYPNVSIVSCPRRFFGKSTKVMGAPLSGVQDGKMVMYCLLKYRNWLGCPSAVMFRRRNLDKERFKNFRWVIDWEMWVRQLVKGDCYLFEEPLCWERKHDQQATPRVLKYYYHDYEEYLLLKAAVKDEVYNINIRDVKLDPELEAKCIEDTIHYEDRSFSAKTLDGLLQERAERCAKRMLTVIPKFKDKGYRQTFIRMAKIAFREKVIIRTLIKESRLRLASLLNYRGRLGS